MMKLNPLEMWLKVLTSGLVHLIFKSLTVINCLKKLMHGIMMDGGLALAKFLET